ncbi:MULTISPECIES: SRPBCC family protein [unclassified Lysobacter]|uniref:SRPBCC family protein n=1 Tax=unclassified Lysobacter TaxID=2635362 RepID=UPI001C239DD8|nr:SRPBCC family protein [Lysobacter sp. MMG2]MBU8977525.1 SRPBCC family protein [Lysobacter sp. MMG2]
MASIQRDIDVEVPLPTAWDALRDVGRIHERLVPGFVADCRMEGRVRVVTFGDGTVVREPILDIDEARHRVAWAAVGSFEHYNASVQAFERDGGGTRLRWIADLLPDEAAPKVAGMIEEGLRTMKRTLEAATRA